MGRYNYTNALNKLTTWAYNEGYEEITFDHDDVSYIDWQDSTLNIPKQIKIEGNRSIELKVYLFLHELGHHQLRKDWEKFKKTLPITAHAEHHYFNKNNAKYTRRIIYNISCIEEEFKAWDEGLLLAKKLNIRVNPVKFNDLKAKSIITHIRYYSTKK